MPYSSAFPPIGQSFIVLPVVDSTNNYAMALVKDGKAQHGNAIFALEQTRGRGQRGKSWITGSGQNIALSVVLQPGSLHPLSPFALSAAVALACYDLFKKYTGEKDLRIKWPNDLYWQDRKAGGILIENQLRGQEWLAAVAGMGLNINQEAFPESAGNAVSLRQVTGNQYDLLELSRLLCENLQRRWEQLCARQDLLAEYQQVLYRRGERVRFRLKNEYRTATVLGVNAAGALLVRNENNEETAVQSGEMEWISEV